MGTFILKRRLFGVMDGIANTGKQIAGNTLKAAGGLVNNSLTRGAADIAGKIGGASLMSGVASAIGTATLGPLGGLAGSVIGGITGFKNGGDVAKDAVKSIGDGIKGIGSDIKYS